MSRKRRKFGAEPGLPKDLDISPDPLIFAVVFASASFFWPTATNMVWKGLWLAELEVRSPTLKAFLN